MAVPPSNSLFMLCLGPGLKSYAHLIGLTGKPIHLHRESVVNAPDPLRFALKSHFASGGEALVDDVSFMVEGGVVDATTLVKLLREGQGTVYLHCPFGAKQLTSRYSKAGPLTETTEAAAGERSCSRSGPGTHRDNVS